MNLSAQQVDSSDGLTPAADLRRWAESSSMIKIALASIVVLYLVSYSILSILGVYRPGCVGPTGIKWYEWTPAGFVAEDYSYREYMVVFYMPVWSIDRKYWHTENHRSASNTDSKIKFKEKLLDDAYFGRP